MHAPLRFSLSLAAISFDAARAADGALAYAPAEATLSGTLEEGSLSRDGADAAGDVTLLLSTPVCGVADPLWLEAHRDVSLIRLVLARAQYEDLARSIGTPVTLSGRLVPQLTTRHHAALMLSDVRVGATH